MVFLEAACGCSRGVDRKTNADNFYFDGRCMEENNRGLKHVYSMCHSLRREQCVAVFDGLGNDGTGDAAAFAAAECMRKSVKKLEDYLIPEKQFLYELCLAMDRAVAEKAKES